jgi:hypothetical protein
MLKIDVCQFPEAVFVDCQKLCVSMFKSYFRRIEKSYVCQCLKAWFDDVYTYVL